jgi:hypothetical protein
MGRNDFNTNRPQTFDFHVPGTHNIYESILNSIEEIIITISQSKPSIYKGKARMGFNYPNRNISVLKTTCSLSQYSHCPHQIAGTKMKYFPTFHLLKQFEEV